MEGGLTRGPGGSLIHIGGLKKSLLRSCPYIAAPCIPMWALLHGRRHAIMLATVTESLFAEILPQRPGLADQSGRPDATK